MKKLIFAIVAGLIPVLVATNGAYAQNSVNPEILEPNKNGIDIEKVVTPSNGNRVDIAVISPKALKSFSKSYQNATGESWDKITDGFTARFVSDGVKNLIYFNTKGQWSGSLKGYTEDKMPKEIRHIVKRDHYDYAITYVQEVETIYTEGKPTYIIHLEDKNSIKQLRINDGEMDVWKEYKKL